MEKRKKIITAAVLLLIIAAAAAGGYKIYDLMFQGTVTVQMSDVKAAIEQCRTQLIIGALILVVGFACLIMGRIRKNASGQVLTVQGCIAVVMAFVITITWICLGPEYSLVIMYLQEIRKLSRKTKKNHWKLQRKLRERELHC